MAMIILHLHFIILNEKVNHISEVTLKKENQISNLSPAKTKINNKLAILLSTNSNFSYNMTFS